MIPITAGRVLVAGAAVAFISLIALPLTVPEVDITIATSSSTITVDESFTATVRVSADVPVNVFAGELQFDPSVLVVDSISYNTSLADLWAEKPWYSNGDGTLNFIGGTTRPGGFTGTDTLLTVTFTAVDTGETHLTMQDARVLRYDGLGSDATINEPIDTVLTVAPEAEEPRAETILKKSGERSSVAVVDNPPSTDLNGDGKQTMADISIFMTHLLTQNLRSDFNQDGTVNTADLSILLNQ